MKAQNYGKKEGKRNSNKRVRKANVLKHNYCIMIPKKIYIYFVLKLSCWTRHVPETNPEFAFLRRTAEQLVLAGPCPFKSDAVNWRGNCLFVWLVFVRQTGAASALMCPANGITVSKQDLPLMRYEGTLNMRARMSQARKPISEARRKQN